MTGLQCRHRRILTGCKVALAQGRGRWRHDKLLGERRLRKEGNGREPSKLWKSRKRAVKDRKRPLLPGQEWDLTLDRNKQLRFSTEISWLLRLRATVHPTSVAGRRSQWREAEECHQTSGRGGGERRLPAPAEGEGREQPTPTTAAGVTGRRPVTAPPPGNLLVIKGPEAEPCAPEEEVQQAGEPSRRDQRPVQKLQSEIFDRNVFKRSQQRLKTG